MYRKKYESPQVVTVTDLGDEICDDGLFGETRYKIVNSDGTRFDGGSIVDEDPDDEDFWNDWNFAKKSTVWEEDE